VSDLKVNKNEYEATSFVVPRDEAIPTITLSPGESRDFQTGVVLLVRPVGESDLPGSIPAGVHFLQIDMLTLSIPMRFNILPNQKLEPCPVPANVD
jgi:hypothetical protein